MSYKRAIANTDMEAYARSIGLKSAADYADHLRLHRRLDGGGRITAHDVERARASDPRIPVETFNQLAEYVNRGATARDRADRYASIVGRGIGVPEHQLAAVREQARRESESFGVQEYVMPLSERLDKASAHRDRQNGIDERARTEAAKRAAMTPEAIRRADIEREVTRHEGGKPTLYARDRRELLAQAKDGIVERMRELDVRESDPRRAPDRGDDRRDRIAIAYDINMSDQAAADELQLAGNPVLEATDDWQTYAEGMEQA